MALPLPAFTIRERTPGQFNLSGELDLATARQLRELANVYGPMLLNSKV